MSAERRRPETIHDSETEGGDHDYDKSHEAMRALAVADTVERPRTLSEILRTPAAKTISALTAVAVIGGGILIGWNKSEKEESVRSGTSSSAPENPGASPSESATDSEVTQFETKADYAATLDTTQAFKDLTSEQQAIIKRYDDMPYANFRQLPEEEQMKFGDFYYQAHEEYGLEQLQRSPFWHAPAGEAVTENAPGQEIVDRFAEHQAVIFYSLAENGSPYNINDGKREDAKKALSWIYPQLMADSTVYTNRASQIDSLESLESDGTSPSNGDGYIVRTVEAESPTGSYLGEKTKFVNVTSPKSDPQQYIFNFKNFTDINGNEKGAWQLKMVVGTENSLYEDVNTVFAR